MQWMLQWKPFSIAFRFSEEIFVVGLDLVDEKC